MKEIDDNDNNEMKRRRTLSCNGIINQIENLKFK
jgi:hypothetical protein